ncbi:hypothetical protein P175DRAFT_0525782 [Aspergillus ochraceoroseus IBT 24754]|uniref:Cyanovirin-N domain-containing protein n=1 Tax=Aspergillus ochraceoroseus IBT 24754 TaxID=1392256 RepID=A0A2T5LNW9_9EURO|nr:uncharacterized protein P175DRAFT_0525782 [Aspergillus ochraceoroseus IBT 24754]PTU17980.1 hypothetical protein P175DRAFT_0525782 [Aspergillus ochraceoroseus IBT 24754]
MKFEVVTLFWLFAGLAMANTCSDRCSDNALCCCCETTHKIPGSTGEIITTWSSQPRCIGQNCHDICNDWEISSKNTCNYFNDRSGYQACEAVGTPNYAADSNFRYFPHGNLASSSWTWESDTIKGAVITSNGLIIWQPNIRINTVCISYKGNGGYHCYKRPAYAACTLSESAVENINNAWGFA